MKTLEFIEELKKQNKRGPDFDYYIMEMIKVGNYWMSIQGSDIHYCSPKKIVLPELYNTMELALFNKKNDWLHITRSKIIKKFPRYKELFDCADAVNSDCPVFAYVPVDLINDLYLYLIKIKRGI